MLPRARRGDPLTSQAAAAAAEELASGHRHTVLQALRQYGQLTVDQIAARTPLMSQQVNKRLPELKTLGLARPTGETRRSASGRRERVWEAVPVAAEAVEPSEELAS